MQANGCAPAKRLLAAGLAAFLLLWSVAAASAGQSEGAPERDVGNATVRIAPSEDSPTKPSVPVAFTG
ncbi:MAG: hypothetical protein ACR2OH_06810 [Microthrixaceae bacterium]